jgi:hypothetical protein
MFTFNQYPVHVRAIDEHALNPSPVSVNVHYFNSHGLTCNKITYRFLGVLTFRTAPVGD